MRGAAMVRRAMVLVLLPVMFVACQPEANGPEANQSGANAPSAPVASGPREDVDVGLVVLGTGQDGGSPQAGTKDLTRFAPGAARLLPTSLGLVDHRSGKRFLFEATPAFPEQLAALDRLMPVEATPGLDGVFLTHAHMGHYTGLMFLGFEVIGAKGTPVYAGPRMASYLTKNGPWSQLVSMNNIELREITEQEPVALGDGLSVTAFRVPHREEFSEAFGLRITGPNRSALFVPDIDSWADLDARGVRFEDLLAGVDYAFIDGTFWANGEVPGRDMSGFPHPRIRESLDRFGVLPEVERKKIVFIHLNHTNPVGDPESRESRTVLEEGFRVAHLGEVFAL